MIKHKKIGIYVISHSKLFPEMLEKHIYKDEFLNYGGFSYTVEEAISIMKKKEINVLIIDFSSSNYQEDSILEKLSLEFPIPTVLIIDKNKKLNLKKEFVPTETITFSKEKEKNLAFFKELFVKIKIISTKIPNKMASVIYNSAISKNESEKIIAIGASTGGVEAISKILVNLPESIPGIIIVQHMPAKFSTLFAERMNSICKILVKEAEDGDEIRAGMALIAPGDKHVKIIKANEKYSVKLFMGEKVSGHCPSVDVLFESVANSAGNKGIGVILTGMGTDGSRGLLMMKKRGAYTIGQDKESSAIYGMPMEAYKIGAVTKQVSLNEISKELISLIK